MRSVRVALIPYRIYIVASFLVATLAYITGWTNHDLEGFFAPWGRLTLQYGVAEVYNRTWIDNGPFAAALLAIPAFFESSFHITSRHAAPFLYKIIPLVGLFLSPFVLRALIDATGVRVQRFSWLVLATVANPAFVYSTAIWGQNDVLLFDFAGLAVVAFLRSRPLVGAALYAGVLFIKPTPFVVFPVLAALAWRSHRPLRVVLGVAIVLVALLPAVIPHGGPIEGYRWLAGLFIGASQEYPYADVGAGTMAAFLGGPGLPPDRLHSVGVLAVLIVALLILYFAAKDDLRHRPRIMWYLALSATAIYWFAPRMHERYLTIGAMAAIGWAFAERRRLPTIAAVTLSTALFLQVFVNGIMNLGWGDDVYSTLSHVLPEYDYFVVYCILNVCGLIALAISRDHLSSIAHLENAGRLAR